jgi:hypothetical protein
MSLQVTQSGGKGTEVKGGPFSRFQAGATALVAGELLQLQEEFSRIQAKYAESLAKQIGMEADMADRAGDMVIASARKEANGILCQAVGGFTGAATQVGGAVTQFAGTRGLNEQYESSLAKANSAKTYQDAFSTRLRNGAATEDMRIGTTSRAGAIDTHTADLRARGDILATGAISDTDLQPMTAGDRGAIDSIANDCDARDGFRTWKDRYDSHMRDANTAQQSINTMYGQISFGTQSVAQVSTSTGQAVQSMYASQKGEKDKERIMAETAKQQADGGVQATRSKVSETERTAIDISQVLKQMNQENQFRG